MEYTGNKLAAELEAADMILIGLGEEFEQKKFLENLPEYAAHRQRLSELERDWLIPFLDGYYLKKYSKELFAAYQNLQKMIEGKNYFIISTAMNETIYECDCFQKEKIVTPCGGFRKLQCQNGCKESLVELPQEQKLMLEKCCEGEMAWEEWNPGVCSQCNEPLRPNNIYLEHYTEDGYLPDWERYLKWTQGTLNRKVAILELGVGLTYPSIIRWPFEKIAFFNQKSSFYRINATLYQMTEELQNKGVSVRKNAVEFLLEEA